MFRRNEKIDIVVTIPKSEYINDDKETEYFSNNEDAFQFWSLSRMPKNLQVNDRVYFVKNNRIDSSMKVFDIKHNSIQHCDVTNRDYTAKCLLYMNDLHDYNDDIKVKGFQGFRYRWWDNA